MMKSKEFTTLLIRLAIGLIFLTAGFSKLAPDNLANIIGPAGVIDKVYNSDFVHIFMIFIAIYQLVTGVLILSQRYSIWGLVLAFPLTAGILIFTVIGGFGLTPIINLFLLALLFYALLQEKDAVKQILKFNLTSGLKISKSYKRYPNKNLVHIAIGLSLLTAILCFLQNPVLNILLTIAFLLFSINLFQEKSYSVIDKVIIILFFIIGSMIINGLYLRKVFPKAFAGVLVLILLGFLLYFIRLIYYRYSVSKISKR